MDVLICKSAQQAQVLVAQLIAERVQAKPGIALGLATGRTMEQMYSELAKHGVSFKRVRTFNLDEYIGYGPGDPQSYWSYMHEHFYSRVNIYQENVHLPDGKAEDFKAAARAYEKLIEASGGIDLQLLGIGRTGHIGFNEPMSSLTSRTRDKTLTQATREQNAAMFGGDVNAVPMRALTMGVGTILQAREIILLATGDEKAEIVARAIEGAITSLITASAVQMHANCKIILDADAAAKLQYADYYRSDARHDPEWAPYQEFFL